jgi:3-oxoacyl-[acyl-carrier-protein] synthase II
MTKRVVITGMGNVNPVGIGHIESFNNLLNKKIGIKTISRFDTTDLSCKIAGEIDLSTINFDEKINPKDQKRMDLFIKYGIYASALAVEDSGIEFTEELKENTGVMVGSGIGGIIGIETNSIIANNDSPKKISPFFIPSVLINMISGHVSIKYGLLGPNIAPVTACATGAHAIGDAFNLIKYGKATAMIAGGAEASISKIGVGGFCAIKALSTGYNDTPASSVRPWDKKRDGFVMGEGAGVVFLEEYEHAKKRGARIYAEVVGYGASADGYHMTSPHPEGKGCALAIKRALLDANAMPSDIGYINAHGTSTPVGDMLELQAVQNVFLEENKNVLMSSTKSSTGHLLGAAGSVESIFAINSLISNVAPPTLNVDELEDGIGIQLVLNEPREYKSLFAMSNSFGFGGTNVSLIFKKV